MNVKNKIGMKKSLPDPVSFWTPTIPRAVTVSARCSLLSTHGARVSFSVSGDDKGLEGFGCVISHLIFMTPAVSKG